MKLIIDIPDKDYEFIKDLQTLVIGSRGNCKTIQYNLINAIKNGVPYEERPHGKWIKTNDYVTCAYGCIDYVKCSCCKNDSLEEGDYCPNCGADMREADNGTN